MAGFTVGMYVAQRVGGIGGLTGRLRRARAGANDAPLGAHGANEEDEALEDFEDIEDDDLELEDVDEALEERVLEAFRNDPVLAERAVDIGSLGDGVVELAGWVEDDEESKHAVTLARGVPGVDTVVNRIALGDEERRFEDAARRVRRGDAALTETHWGESGRTVGTGRRRQGTSDEPDRHASSKVPLENRWQGADDAIRNAADDIEPAAERRRGRAGGAARGDRTGGGPVTPTGVSKADHVARPLDAARDVGRAAAPKAPDSARTEPTERG